MWILCPQPNRLFAQILFGGSRVFTQMVQTVKWQSNRQCDVQNQELEAHALSQNRYPRNVPRNSLELNLSPSHRVTSEIVAQPQTKKEIISQTTNSKQRIPLQRVRLLNAISRILHSSARLCGPLDNSGAHVSNDESYERLKCRVTADGPPGLPSHGAGHHHSLSPLFRLDQLL